MLFLPKNANVPKKQAKNGKNTMKLMRTNHELSVKFCHLAVNET